MIVYKSITLACSDYPAQVFLNLSQKTNKQKNISKKSTSAQQTKRINLIWSEDKPRLGCMRWGVLKDLRIYLTWTLTGACLPSEFPGWGFLWKLWLNPPPVAISSQPKSPVCFHNWVCTHFSIGDLDGIGSDLNLGKMWLDWWSKLLPSRKLIPWSKHKHQVIN